MLFYKVFFDKEYSKHHKKENICGRKSLSPSGHPIFSNSPIFQNLGLKVVPPEESVGADTVK